MRYPAATWRGPIPNQGGPLSNPTIGVIHIMEGSLSGTDSWFHNPAAQVSSHFGIGKAGQVYQWVDTNTVAWAQKDFNGSAISIEHEGFTGDKLTNEQVKADQSLVSWVNRTHSIPLVMSTSTGWCGHGQLGMAGGNHPNCPGQPILDQWPTVLAGVAPPVPTIGETMDDLTFIRWAYLEYMAREPDPTGFASWNDYLSKGGSRGDLIATLVDMTAEGKAVLAGRRKAAFPPLA